MKADSSETLRRWAKAWQRAGEFLEEERARRLRRMTDDEVRACIADLFPVDAPPPSDRTDSGLVEQQRLFGKLR